MLLTFCLGTVLRLAILLVLRENTSNRGGDLLRHIDMQEPEDLEKDAE
jgi:hypothetical protein